MDLIDHQEYIMVNRSNNININDCYSFLGYDYLMDK